ncbi:Aprataxin-like protein [Yarrowia sp. C11]|nr:Aprataxin-like protein [Yarrowia sp. C11]KAG5370518.1 Aprataxin-like protein [Yarrowia sp. E02]
MSWKYALGQYIEKPQKFPKDVFLDTPDFVVINDAFPKSHIHYLVLPKGVKPDTHPLKAFEDNELYEKTLDMVEKVEKMVAVEFIRSKGYSKYVKIQSGIHSVPSMNHVHVHVMTTDLSSPRLKNRTHFNSFKTDFFVPFRTIPDLKVSNLDSWMASQEKLIKGDIVVDGENYGNKFAKAKRRLDEDFEKATIHGIPEKVEEDDVRVSQMVED